MTTCPVTLYLSLWLPSVSITLSSANMSRNNYLPSFSPVSQCPLPPSPLPTWAETTTFPGSLSLSLWFPSVSTTLSSANMGRNNYVTNSLLPVSLVSLCLYDHLPSQHGQKYVPTYPVPLSLSLWFPSVSTTLSSANMGRNNYMPSSPLPESPLSL